MSAPTPAPGDSSPTSGYYPDPSIPGYIRYWNGAAWVPGTSRPAPAEGEPLPAPPGGAEPAPQVVPEQQVAPAEETGPMFLDEQPAAGQPAVAQPAAQEPAAQEPVRSERAENPEPASAWQADASRQAGFGGEQARRVSWGEPPQGAPASQDTPAAHTAPAAQGEQGTPQQPSGEEQRGGRPAPGARTDGTVTIRALKPGRAPQQGTPQQGTPQQGGAPQNEPGQGQRPPADGTMMVRRVRPGGNAPGAAPGAQGGTPKPPEPGTMAIRALPDQPAPQQPAPQQPAPQQGGAPAQGGTPAPGYGYPQPGSPQVSTGYGYPQPGSPQQGAPAQGGPAQGAPGSGYGYPPPQSGGGASWPQQVQQLAQDGDAGPVTPFKPPTSDPFLAAAQAQAAARPAGLGKRLAARLIDTVVLAAVTGAVAVPLMSKSVAHIDGKIQDAKMSGLETTVWLLDGTTSLYFGIVLAVLLVFGVLYEALPTSKWGVTLGKKLLKLEVRDIEEHSSPTFAAALRRWLVYSIPGVLVIGVLGVLWCLWDKPWRQCWHDKAARTFVAG